MLTSSGFAAWHGYGGWGGPGPVLPLAVTTLLVTVAVVVLYRTRRQLRTSPDRADSIRAGERVLAERYARDELTDEQYRAKIAVLRQGNRS